MINNILKYFFSISTILLSSMIFVNITFASNTQRADTIYQYLDEKYKVFPIEEQEQNRETMKSLFYQIERKTDNTDLLILVDMLRFKAERKINGLQRYREDYPTGNDDLSNITQLRFEMLGKINQERSKKGLTSLILNDQLDISSQLHAQYMAKTDDFAHTTKNGLTFDQRIRNAGYKGNTMGENIARNQRTIEQVMDAWMNSPGHKANILNSKFTEVGIGFSDYYWVQNFGS